VDVFSKNRNGGDIWATRPLGALPNEGLDLLEDLVNSSKNYDLHVGDDIPNASPEPQKNKDQSVGHLTKNPRTQREKDTGKTAVNRPPGDIDAEIFVRPDFENAGRTSKTNLGVAPLWTGVFHELAEAFAEVEGKGMFYPESHAVAMNREDHLRWQRPGLQAYNPGSGGPANTAGYESITALPFKKVKK
jgi:hypothetical protein